MKKPSTPKYFSLLRKKISKTLNTKSQQKRGTKVQTKGLIVENDDSLANITAGLDFQQIYHIQNLKQISNLDSDEEITSEGSSSFFTENSFSWLVKVNLKKKIKGVNYERSAKLFCGIYYTISDVQKALDLTSDSFPSLEPLSDMSLKLPSDFAIFSASQEYNKFLFTLQEKILQKKGGLYSFYFFIYEKQLNFFDLYQRGSSLALLELLQGEDVSEIALEMLHSEFQPPSVDKETYLHKLSELMGKVLNKSMDRAEILNYSQKTVVRVKSGQLLSVKLNYEVMIFKQDHKWQIVLFENMAVKPEEIELLKKMKLPSKEITMKNTNKYTTEQFHFLQTYYKNELPLNSFEENSKRVCGIRPKTQQN